MSKSTIMKNQNAAIMKNIDSVTADEFKNETYSVVLEIFMKAGLLTTSPLGKKMLVNFTYSNASYRTKVNKMYELVETFEPTSDEYLLAEKFATSVGKIRKTNLSLTDEFIRLGKDDYYFNELMKMFNYLVECKLLSTLPLARDGYVYFAYTKTTIIPEEQKFFLFGKDVFEVIADIQNSMTFEIPAAEIAC